MRKIQRIGNLIITIFMISVLHNIAFALTDETLFSQIQFNFVTSGARAIGMGGAVIGLADDATTAGTNPAGLTALFRPEISSEFQYLIYSPDFLYENRRPDTNVTYRGFDDYVECFPSTNIVFPYERFSFLAYREEIANYEISYRTSIFGIVLPETDSYFYPREAVIDMNINNYGIGIALELLEDKLSIAVSPTWSYLQLHSTSTQYGLTSLSAPSDTSYDTPQTHFDIEDFQHKIDGRDNGFVLNWGLMWKPHSKISFGVVYKPGAKFHLLQTYRRPFMYDEISEQVLFGQGWNEEFTLDVPDMFGGGVAFFATNFLTFTLDIIHIQYKDLLEGLYGTEFIVTSPTRGGCIISEILPIVGSLDFRAIDHYTVDNVTEIHAGMEYLFYVDKRLFALRTGAYYEPEHNIRFTGTTGDPLIDLARETLAPRGEDQIHVTGGLGIELNKNFRIDVAFNVSKQTKQFSTSAVYRF